MTSRQKALKQGKDRYFTGRPCNRGHTAERYTKGGQCIKCTQIEGRKRYARNSELARQQAKDWRARNPELSRWRVKNWRARNRELERQRTKEWRACNQESVRQRIKEWRVNNPEKVRISKALRRARQMNAIGYYTFEDVKHLMNEQEGICAAPLCFENVKIYYHVDHIIPLSCGGSNWPENLQILCPSCNLSKGAKSWDVWLAEGREIV